MESARARMTLPLLVALPMLASCQAVEPIAADALPAQPAVAMLLPAASVKADEISIEQLAVMLPRRPVVVGFDVDETLITSGPAFEPLVKEYDADVIRPRDSSRLSLDQKFLYREFWNRLNEEYDDRSKPKAIAKKLLDLHIARGDDIWIISRRQSSQPDTGTCARRYERMFDVKLAHPVIFTQLRDSTPFIAERRIEYFYGDADAEMTAAIAAGAVPIRIKRNAMASATATDIAHVGQLGEAVLKDSQR